MLRRMLMITVLIAAVAAMFNARILAHHSVAAYGTSAVTLRGTVVDYVWQNPHVVVIWDVTDEGGKVVRWSGELASVMSSMADGLNKNSLKPGDDVVMKVNPAKSGTPSSIIKEIKRADGIVVFGQKDTKGNAANAGDQN